VSTIIISDYKRDLFPRMPVCMRLPPRVGDYSRAPVAPPWSSIMPRVFVLPRLAAPASCPFAQHPPSCPYRALWTFQRSVQRYARCIKGPCPIGYLPMKTRMRGGFHVVPVVPRSRRGGLTPILTPISSPRPSAPTHKPAVQRVSTSTQTDSAAIWGSSGRRFKSCQPDQSFRWSTAYRRIMTCQI
jgi:hypothetical protein